MAEAGVDAHNMLNNPPYTDDIENTNVADDVLSQEEHKNQNKKPQSVTLFAPKYQQEEIEKLLRLADDDMEKLEKDDTISDATVDYESKECDHDNNYQPHSETITTEQQSTLCQIENNNVDESWHEQNINTHNSEKIPRNIQTIGKHFEFDAATSRPIPAPRNLFFKPKGDENNNDHDVGSKSYVETCKIPFR